ncbi:MAG: glutamate synthase central domain-containing protein [Phycisphaerales bacterium]|nr:glutamate synthase central domain-containing protein [Phycisphaerales bacterium]
MYPNLYRPEFEKDACGVGFIANWTGLKSYDIIRDALTILENMEHRGARNVDTNIGDGAGILLQMPHEFLLRVCKTERIILPPYGSYASGLLFLSKDETIRNACKKIIFRVAQELGLHILGFRIIPTDATILDPSLLNREPYIEQIFIQPINQSPELLNMAFERKLYVFRNYVTHVINATIDRQDANFYIVSLSAKTIIYKGHLTSGQLRRYFVDLVDEQMVSSFAMVHSRFATNTRPSWRLAHPYKYLAHNGEINTLVSNHNWFKSHIKNFASPYFSSEELAMLSPIMDGDISDSGNLDNLVELLYLSGFSLPQVMMMLIPECWEKHTSMNQERRAFYQYYAPLISPWDGPATVTFTDGHIIGAILDRNGLRPARYWLTNDNRMILASEVGVLDIAPAGIIKKGRLNPGSMILVDTTNKKVYFDDEIKKTIYEHKPYQQWIKKNKVRLEDIQFVKTKFGSLNSETINRYQCLLGYTEEDVKSVIIPMALDAKEPISSMALDIPLAILSQQPQHLSSYFKQLFAQVTNPPIDPIRENMVMSMTCFLGVQATNIMVDNEISCRYIELAHPILSSVEVDKLRSIDLANLQTKTIFTYFQVAGGEHALEKAIAKICNYAEDAIEEGFSILIISDRNIGSEHAQIPSLLVIAAIHHFLVAKGLRNKVSLVVEAADVWEVHHFACLFAFGASAINPYLALSIIRDVKQTSRLQTTQTVDELRKNYIKAVCDGLLKIMSKLGISTLQGYQGSQSFEILGIHQEVVDQYFTGAVSRLGGLSIKDIQDDILKKHGRTIICYQKVVYISGIKLVSIIYCRPR